MIKLFCTMEMIDRPFACHLAGIGFIVSFRPKVDRRPCVKSKLLKAIGSALISPLFGKRAQAYGLRKCMAIDIRIIFEDFGDDEVLLSGEGVRVI